MDELREKIAKELFDIWKDAKSTCEENWEDQDFESLPDKHKQEYYLTANRIIDFQAGYQKITEPPVLSEDSKVERGGHTIAR